MDYYLVILSILGGCGLCPDIPVTTSLPNSLRQAAFSAFLSGSRPHQVDARPRVGKLGHVVVSCLCGFHLVEIQKNSHSWTKQSLLFHKLLLPLTLSLPTVFMSLHSQKMIIFVQDSRVKGGSVRPRGPNARHLESFRPFQCSPPSLVSVYTEQGGGERREKQAEALLMFIAFHWRILRASYFFKAFLQ